MIPLNNNVFVTRKYAAIKTEDGFIFAPKTQIHVKNRQPTLFIPQVKKFLWMQPFNMTNIVGVRGRSLTGFEYIHEQGYAITVEFTPVGFVLYIRELKVQIKRAELWGLNAMEQKVMQILWDMDLGHSGTLSINENNLIEAVRQATYRMKTKEKPKTLTISGEEAKNILNGEGANK